MQMYRIQTYKNEFSHNKKLFPTYPSRVTEYVKRSCDLIRFFRHFNELWG